MQLGLKYLVDSDGKKRLTIPDDRRAFAVSYIRDGGARSPAEIEAIVQQGHDELLAALDGLSEPQAAHKPAADDWSVLELMAHVVTTKRIIATLAASLGEGKLPPGFTAELEEESRQDGVTVARFDALAAARDAADAAHRDQLRFIRGLDDSTNVDVRFKHFVFGALNCREWAAFQRVHDADHTPQIGAIRASSGFPAHRARSN